LGLTGQVEAPTSTEDPELNETEQVDLLQGRLEDGYQGLAVSPYSAAVTEVIDDFVDAGATVVTFDSDAPDSKRQLYVGTDNAQAGKTGGETLVNLLKEAKAAEGSVVVFGNQGWPAGEERTLAAVDAVEAAGYSSILYQLQWDPPSLELSAEEVPVLIEEADPPVVGMVGVFNNSFHGAEYAEAMGYEPGELKIVAFDFEPETLGYMESGYIQATHAQRQYYQGYMVPYIVYSIHALGLKKTKQLLGDHLIGGSSFDTGMDVVPADQLDEFNDFLDSLGIGGG